MNTGKMTTIARPYALAAFENALAHHAVSDWEQFLQAASVIALNEDAQSLIMNPRATPTQLGEFFCDILSSSLSEQQKNFIRLLADNRRLSLLPEIATLFKGYREEHDKTLTVRVASAIPLDAAYQQKLTDALTKRFKRNVTMTCEVDPRVLAGAVVYAGDTVIDGSVRGKLNRLIEFIS